jgi:predicted nucleic acid-binding protein
MAKRARKNPETKTQLVLDCSVVLAWFFSDEKDAYADQVAVSLTTATAIVPAIWPLEVANTLLVGERRKRCTHAQAASFLAGLACLPIRIEDQTSTLAWSSIYPLARAHQLSAYDAAYIELALRDALPLCTLDTRLEATAATLGIARFAP